MAKKKVIFDIAPFAFSQNLSGVTRFTLEVLKRIIKREHLEIVLICSLKNEAKAFFNLRSNLDFNLPFQSKERKELIFSQTDAFLKKKQKDENRRPTFLGRVEDFFLLSFPKSKLLKSFFDIIRKIKWTIFPPPPIQDVVGEFDKWETLPRSQYFEELVMESDVYFSPFHPLIPELSIKSTIRNIVVIHDLISFVYPEFQHKSMQIMLREIADHITPDLFVITVSENSKQDIKRFFPPVIPDKLVVVQEGASSNFKYCTDIEKIHSVLKKYGIPTDCQYITSIAIQDDRKNFGLVINAFGKLCERYPDKFANLRLVLTGPDIGYQKKNLRKAFDALSTDCKKKFIYTGYVEDNDLPFIYNGASCFCYMSFYEGFGLPLLEAMQSGTPVIASDTSSHPEVVGDAGLLVNPNDVDDLVDAFYRVLTDEYLRNEMITKGLEQAKKFSWDDCVNIICDKIINT
jgi:glycosyltransferase involved in cell wall biosynthesis